MTSFSLENLLQTHPETFFKFAAYTFAFAGIMFLGSFIVEHIRKHQINDEIAKKSLRSLPKAMRFVSIIALILTLARLEGLPYLSMRIWWIALILVFIIFEIYAFIKFRKNKQKHVLYATTNKNQEEVTKYLPKKKKRK